MGECTVVLRSVQSQRACKLGIATWPAVCAVCGGVCIGDKEATKPCGSSEGMAGSEWSDSAMAAPAEVMQT